MMRTNLVILLILLTLPACAGDRPGLAAVVGIELESEEYVTGVSYVRKGTGFFVSKTGFVATCWHLVEPFGLDDAGVRVPRFNRGLQVRHDGKTWPAKVVAFDSINDLAILSTAAMQVSFVPHTSLKAPKVGDRLNKALEQAKLTVVRQHRTTAGSVLLETDQSFAEGESGSPIFYSNGNLAGVAKSYTAGEMHKGIMIPATALNQLLKDVDIKAPLKATGPVTIESKPLGAEVFRDGRRLGVTPMKAELPGGLARFRIVHPAYGPWGGLLPLRPGLKIHAALRKQSLFKLTTGTTPLPDKITMPVVGRDLLRIKLDPENNPPWLKLAGPDWDGSGNLLQLTSTSPVLHVCTFAGQAWDNYVFSAQVSIVQGKDNARAGLIFRSGPSGFYCLRILPKRGVAQLTWHNRNPFGWLILNEYRLDAIKPRNLLRIYAYKDHITCTVNGAPIAVLTSELSSRGRVGVYGSGAKAEFANLVVSKIHKFDTPKTSSQPCSAFWFYDRFNGDGTAWQTNLQNWLHTSAGAVVSLSKSPATAVAANFVLGEFDADLVYKMGKGPTGTIGFSFARHQNGGGELVSHDVVIDRQRGRISLSARCGKELQTLSTSKLDPKKLATLFGRPQGRLILQVRQKRIVLKGTDLEYLSCPLKTPVPSGRFGITTGGVPFLLQGLMLSSPDNPDT